jgi:hypothetical protein
VIVTVKPQGRSEYRIRTDGAPRFSSSLAAHGYEAAEVPVEWYPEDFRDLLGARLRIHGESGIAWQGIVKRRPSRDDPLQAQGWGWCGTLNLDKRIYAKTDWPSELTERRDAAQNSAAFSTSVSGGTIMMSQSPGTTCDAGDRVSVWYWGDVPLDRLEFDGYVNHADVSLRIYASTAPSGFGSLVYNQTATGTASSQTADLGGAYGFAIMCHVDVTPSTPSRMDKYVTVSNGVLYGTDLATVDTSSVAEHIIDNEIDSMWLPAGDAYRAWIESESTTIEPLVFDSCDANSKFDELSKHAAYDLGWYVEHVGGIPYCVPHWSPRSTTPDYILKVDEAESVDIEEAALDELVSVMRVNYETADGRPTHTDVTDTDPDHPLVRLGITRYGEITAQTSSEATATTIGQLALTEKGRAQVKGSATTRYLYTATGVPAYLPSVRPGEIVRVMGLEQGHVDCIVRRLECAGDEIATLTLDNEPYRLDIALARLAKRK